MSSAPAAAPTDLERFRTIVIEGPIGVGKTTLARKLAAHLGTDLLLEKTEDNPYLERFYGDMPGFAFQTQLFFLFQRVKQMQALAQPGMFSVGVVSDFLFAKDALFARLNLSDDEYRLYTQARLAARSPGRAARPAVRPGRTSACKSGTHRRSGSGARTARPLRTGSR